MVVSKFVEKKSSLHAFGERECREKGRGSSSSGTRISKGEVGAGELLAPMVGPGVVQSAMGCGIGHG